MSISPFAPADAEPFLWIGGRRVPTADGFEVCNPYSGAVARSAGEASDEGAWAAIEGAVDRPTPPIAERVDVLERAAAWYEAELDAAALLITAEAGICLKDSRHEVRRSITALRAAAREAAHLASRDWEAPYRVPGESPGPELSVIAEPVRLAIAVSPFNHPLNQVVHKVAPALAAGAALVLKPSEKAPLSALRLAEVLTACGLPPHQVNVVTGRSPERLVRTLVTDPRVELVSFTGSVPTGRAIARTMAAGGNELVRYVPELGGNAVFVVLADADLDRAVRIALGAFDNAGQRCTAINRILVEEPVADRFVERLTALAGALRWGDPFDPATDVGPVIDEAAAARIERAVQAARSAGARLCTGGTRRGALIAPTVLDHVAPGMEIAASETFGPVAAVIRVGSLDDCIEVVRADGRRLAGAIATTSRDAALTYGAAVRLGQLSWNGPPGYRTEAAPFGGFGDSGNGAKEGIVEAVRGMLNVRTFWGH